MGLHRGRIHGIRAGIFYISYGLSLVFFGWLAPRPSNHAVGARSLVCAEFESSCNKIRALCDVWYPRARSCSPRVYLRKGETYIQAGSSAYIVR